MTVYTFLYQPVSKTRLPLWPAAAYDREYHRDKNNVQEGPENAKEETGEQ